MRWLALVVWLPAVAFAQTPLELVYDHTCESYVNSHGMAHDEARVEGSGIATLFSAPLNTNGLTAADPASSWPVTGVTAPDVAWWGDDPTGSGTATTGTWTAAGDPTSGIDTPFCPDGSHSDVTSGCMQAVRFDGTGDWYDSDSTGTMNCNSADCTVCSVHRFDNAAGAAFIAAEVDQVGNSDGWVLAQQDIAGGGKGQFKVENTAAGSVVVYWDKIALDLTDGWVLLCGTHDFDGNTLPYLNGDVDSGGASPGGTINTSEVIASIGARSEDHLLPITGDIAAVFFWNSLLDATDMAELFEYFVGILDNEGAPVAFTSTGPNCCWIDGAIECFSDDWPMIGCELPPGVTGAGSPASGFYSGEALTNSAIYSRAINTQTAVGTPTETATSVDLFRDGRQTIRVCDDDGAAVEGEAFAIDVTALETGDDIKICVYAKDSAGTVLDLQVDESGVCAGSTQDFSAATITSSWAGYPWTHILSDGDCTTATYKISPTDWGTVASTTCAEWVVQAFVDQDWCPPTYTETAAAAVGSGASQLEFGVTNLVDGSGNFANGQTLSFNFAPRNTGDLRGSSYFFSLSDGGDSDYLSGYISAASDDGALRSRTGGGAPATVLGMAGIPLVAGTAGSYEAKYNFVTDAYSSNYNGITDTDSVPRTSPTGVNTFAVGIKFDDTYQPNGWISNVTVTSP